MAKYLTTSVSIFSWPCPTSHQIQPTKWWFLDVVLSDNNSPSYMSFLINYKTCSTNKTPGSSSSIINPLVQSSVWQASPVQSFPVFLCTAPPTASAADFAVSSIAPKLFPAADCTFSFAPFSFVPPVALGWLSSLGLKLKIQHETYVYTSQSMSKYIFSGSKILFSTSKIKPNILKILCKIIKSLLST